jgi:glucose dehydrogenase
LRKNKFSATSFERDVTAKPASVMTSTSRRRRGIAPVWLPAGLVALLCWTKRLPAPNRPTDVVFAEHRFNTVPKPGEPASETRKNPSGIPVGGGSVWTTFSLDTGNGDLHVAVTNPAPDLPIHLRQGDDLYTNSIVVLDVRTGKLR